VKICQVELYCLYIDSYTKFDDLSFDELNALETINNNNLPMSWCVDLNGEKVYYLMIEFLDSKYFVNQHCLVTSEMNLMFMLNFELCWFM
jgi:hypothetical protein